MEAASRAPPHPTLCRGVASVFKLGRLVACRLVMAYAGKQGYHDGFSPIEVCSPFPCFNRSRKIVGRDGFTEKFLKFITRTWRANFDSIELYKAVSDVKMPSCHVRFFEGSASMPNFFRRKFSPYQSPRPGPLITKVRRRYADIRLSLPFARRITTDRRVRNITQLCCNGDHYKLSAK